MEKSNLNNILNIFFCASQDKKSHVIWKEWYEMRSVSDEISFLYKLF